MKPAFQTLSVTLVFLAILSVINVCVSQDGIGADRGSTLKIGRAICDPKSRNQGTVDMFFGCYDYAPGKEQFVSCQRKIYGQDLSTVRGICNLCKSSGKLSQYAACLGQELKVAGVDMMDAVTKLNKCQAYVLGVM